MKQFIARGSFGFLAVMVAASSWLFIDERRSHRAGREEANRTLQDAVQANARKSEVILTEVTSGLKRLCAGQDELTRVLHTLASVSRPDAESAGGVDGEAVLSDEAVPTPDVGSDVGARGLPPIPNGVNPRAVLKASTDLKSVLEDPRFNPSQRTLSRAERFKCHAEFVRAKAKLDVLDVEIKAAVTEAMERLRAGGEYVDYAKGEKYRTVPGVLTSAEGIEDGGTRMYYLYKEDYPEIYAMRGERGGVATTALQRVLAILQPDFNNAPEAK